VIGGGSFETAGGGASFETAGGRASFETAGGGASFETADGGGETEVIDGDKKDCDGNEGGCAGGGCANGGANGCSWISSLSGIIELLTPPTELLSSNNSSNRLYPSDRLYPNSSDRLYASDWLYNCKSFLLTDRTGVFANSSDLFCSANGPSDSCAGVVALSAALTIKGNTGMTLLCNRCAVDHCRSVTYHCRLVADYYRSVFNGCRYCDCYKKQCENANLFTSNSDGFNFEDRLLRTLR